MKKLCKACKILMVFVMCFGAILLANNVFAAKNFGPTPIILHECEAGSWQNYNEGYHVKKCTVTGCGEIMETASHNNKLTWTGTTHTKTCNDCGGKYTRNHTYNKETGKCTGCPYVCVHSNCEIKYNSNNHWEECRICGFKRSDAKHSIRDGECTKPGCGYKCEHEYEAGVCTECGYECKSHRYNSQGVCSICEYKDPAICNHYVWEWKTTNTMHIKVCKEGCNKELSTGTHTYSKETGKCTACNYSCKHSSYTWRWTGDTHTKICAACDYTISTENHIYGETLGDCEMCPYVCEHKYTAYIGHYTEEERLCIMTCEYCQD